MNPPELSKFALRLIAHRKKHKHSQESLGEALGSHQTTVGDWEKDAPNSSPSWRQIKKLCEMFGVSADYLLGLSDAESGLAPDSFITNEDRIAKRREDPNYEAPLFLIKVPRNHRVIGLDEAEKLRKELRLKKLDLT